MSSNEVMHTDGLTVKIHTKKKNKRDTLSGPGAQRYYVAYFNAVDKNYHYRSFDLATIQTIYHYLGILCWSLNHLFHNIFVVLFYLDKLGIGKSEWKKYFNIKKIRHDSQIDFAISLINFAIALEWGGKSKCPG